MKKTNEELVKEIRIAENNEIRNQLMQELYDNNIALIVKIAKSSYKECPVIDLDDLKQSGFLGLVDAVDGWDEEKGAFITYAYNCIKHRITQQTRRLSNCCRINHRSFDNEEIMKKVNAKSLDEDYGLVGGNNLGNLISDNKDVFEDVLMSNAIINILESFLNERERYVLIQRLNGLQWNEIGELIGVTAQRANQIYAKAIKTLQAHPQAFEALYA